MDIHEFQAKALIAAFCNKSKVRLAPGKVISQESATATQEVGAGFDELFKDNDTEIVIKAQVHTGGRGKAGGVKVFNKTQKSNATEFATGLLGKILKTYQAPKGLPVSSVYMSQAYQIKKELYLSFLVNRTNECISIIASSEGGVEIEAVAEKTPEKVITIDIVHKAGVAYADLFSQGDYVDQIVKALDLDPELGDDIKDLCDELYRLMIKCDINLMEINPLGIVTLQGRDRIVVIDAKFSIDDNALWRQPEILAMRDKTQEDILESQAKDYGLAYIKLDGSIGCMVNGAGLAMATMDIANHFGQAPANFLDVGGGASEEGTREALGIILQDNNVKAVLVNIFGGIVRCDMIAKSILAAIKSLRHANPDLKLPPFVIRLSGTNSSEAKKIIEDVRDLGPSNPDWFDITPADDLEKAAKLAVEKAV